MRERTLEGTWWVPGAADHKIGGRLTFTPSDGCRLELLGGLTTDKLFSIAGVRVPVIHGWVSSTETGNDITLFDSSRAGTTVHGRFSRQSLRPRLAALGAHLESRERLKVKSCEASFTQLPNWLMAGGFVLRLPRGRWKAGQKLKYTLRYNPITLPLVRTPICSFTFELRSLPPLVAARTYPLHESVTVRIRPTEPVAFENLRAFWHLQNFFTFAADAQSRPTSVHVNITDDSRLLELLFAFDVEAGEPAHPLEMLFVYPTIAERASEVFSRWFELYEQLGPALNSMLSVVYGRIGLTDIRFLNVLQAAESYDRRMRGESIVTPLEHEQRVASIIAASPVEYREWVSGKLAHSDEPFLNERLGRMFGRLGKPFVTRMFSSRTKMKRQLWRMAEWRNRLTHVTAEADEIDKGLRFLHVATNQILTALKANLLLDLGFSEVELAECFKHNQMYLFFSRQEEDHAAEDSS
jgi:hypothetical protein